jgi:hypothetical protein
VNALDKKRRETREGFSRNEKHMRFAATRRQRIIKTEKELVGFAQRKGKFLSQKENKNFPHRNERGCSECPGDLFPGIIRPCL